MWYIGLTAEAQQFLELLIWFWFRPDCCGYRHKRGVRALRALPLMKIQGLLLLDGKADDGVTALYCIDVAGKSCQKLG